MIRGLIVFMAAILLTAPAIAQQKPLVSIGGQTRQLPAGVTLGVNPGVTGAASINIPPGVAPTAPNNGDCWVTPTTGWTCQINGNTVISPAVVSNNAALAATPSQALRAVRMGFYTEGDVTPLFYHAGGTACSLNAGAGDGASQVPSSDGKCWLAALPSEGIDVKQFGAVCDATADDTAAVQNALSFANPTFSAIVLLPPGGLCKITSTLVLSQGITLRGAGMFNSGLTAGTSNLTMISVIGNSAAIENMYIDMLVGSTPNTTGTAISTATITYGRFENLILKGPCYGIDITGSFSVVSNVIMENVVGSECVGMRIGHNSVSAASTDIHVDKTLVYSDPLDPAYACFVIEDAGGLFLSESDAIWCTYGTRITPGANQSVAWATLHDTYLGDTNASHGLVIDTGAATAIIQGLSCNNCWASSSTAGDGVWIGNSNAGIVSGLSFNQLRAFTNGLNGFSVNAAGITGIALSDSHICSYGMTSSGFYAAFGAGDFAIKDTEIRPACANRPSSGGNGLFLSGSNSSVRIGGLNLRGNLTESVGTPTGDSFVGAISDLDNNSLPIASAATLTLVALYKNWIVTGTTGVSTITGNWNGREVRLITPDGPILFTGGNICATYTSVQNVPILATYLGSCWYLK